MALLADLGPLELVYTLIILLISSENINCQCHLGNSNTETSHALVGASYKSFTARNYSECLTRCVRSTGCKSLNFLLVNGTCELNSETKNTRPDLYVRRENSIYTTKTAYHLELMWAGMTTSLSSTTNSTTTQPPTTHPTTQSSTTQSTTTQSTTTDPPTTQPTTQTPTTQKPTTDPQTTQKPTNQSPTTQSMTTQPPTTQLTTQSPTTQLTTTDLQTTQKPTTQSPTTQSMTTHPPTTQPTIQSTITQLTTTDPPTTQKPTTQSPITQSQTTDPLTTKSTTLSPTTDPPKKQPTTLSPTIQPPTTQAAQVSYPRSCFEILRNGGSVGDGVYSIDPNKEGIPMQAYCDMTTDGGGWTIIKRTIFQTSTPPQNKRIRTYEVISEFNSNDLNIFPISTALLDIKNTMGFHQIHYYCHKQSVGRVVSIRTRNNTAGHQVVRQFTDDEFAKSNFVAACDSFDRLPEDTSVLGQNCVMWNKNTGTWGKNTDTSRTLTTAFFIKGSNSFGCSVNPPKVDFCACDDDYLAPLPYNPQDRWQISVR